MDVSTETTQKGRFQFSYAGNGTEMAILMLKNLFFTIITLGIYRAWAKTNTRRYLWENVKFMGDGGTYVGTGGELFRGWMKLLGILLVLVVVSKAVETLVPILKIPIALIVPFFYLFVFALATYAGLRYRLSRTLWRQIRFGVDKDEASTKEFTKLYLKGVLFSILTLGFYYSIFRNQVRTYLTNRSRLGSAYFKYDGSDDAYFKMYCKGLLLSIITLGIYVPWFMAKLISFRLKHTSFQGARFEFTMPGKDIFVYGLMAYIGTIFTFGLAVPWIFTWGLRKITENIYLEGELDLSSIRQRASDGSAMADDIVAEYDLDLGF
ncbi:YjgN family protein [Bdellovibrio bacteriovorus]|uniref:YjgN family protein n=1 Tax=Bdellovibrio TaxID=958 RepID=UPI0035A95AF6